MATFNAEVFRQPTLLFATAQHISAEIVSNAAPTETFQYFMVWSDPDCGPPQARYWYATFEDTTGTQYVGPKCGATPITGASVLKRLVTG